MTQSSGGLEMGRRYLLHTIKVPSGENFGFMSMKPSDVRRWRPVPSALTISTPSGPRNTIRLPSGDQSGHESEGLSVTCISPLPSALTVQMLPTVSRRENTILSSVGDH